MNALIMVTVIVAVSVVGGLFAPRLMRWDVRKHEPSVTARLALDATRWVAAFESMRRSLEDMQRSSVTAGDAFRKMAEQLRTDR